MNRGVSLAHAAGDPGVVGVLEAARDKETDKKDFWMEASSRLNATNLSTDQLPSSQ